MCSEHFKLCLLTFVNSIDESGGKTSFRKHHKALHPFLIAKLATTQLLCYHYFLHPPSLEFLAFPIVTSREKKKKENAKNLSPSFISFHSDWQISPFFTDNTLGWGNTHVSHKPYDPHKYGMESPVSEQAETFSYINLRRCSKIWDTSTR